MPPREHRFFLPKNAENAQSGQCRRHRKDGPSSLERINLSSIKKESVRAIFQAITEKDKISRAEIAEITGLSLMTVGKVVDALLERNVICQSKESKNAAGRKAGLVSLSTKKFLMVIDITTRNFSMIVMDFALGVVDRVSYDYNSDFYSEENFYLFMKNVKLFMLRKLDMDDCIGIGVLLPGTYDPETDLVETTRVPELSGTHIRSIIEDVLRVPVDLFQKDVLAAASSNLTDLENGEKLCVAYICLSDTVSGTLLSEGRVVRSRSGFAGDIGRAVTAGGKTLRDSFSARGLREETIIELAAAVSAEIAVFDPDAVLIENCTGTRFGDHEQLLLSKIAASFRLPPEELPDIRVIESTVRHAYRGLAYSMRQNWIQKEID